MLHEYLKHLHRNGEAVFKLPHKAHITRIGFGTPRWHLVSALHLDSVVDGIPIDWRVIVCDNSIDCRRRVLIGYSFRWSISFDGAIEYVVGTGV
jgi:hypothetical protein